MKQYLAQSQVGGVCPSRRRGTPRSDGAAEAGSKTTAPRIKQAMLNTDNLGSKTQEMHTIYLSGSTYRM